MSKDLLFTYGVRIALSWMFCCLPFCVGAQKIQVRDIPRIDKLSTNHINDIFQDSEGYVWYATDDGLCRDDGYQIHTFRSDFRHPDVLPNNGVTCLGEDSLSHRIWVGTKDGLYVLDKLSYTISPVKEPDLKNVAIEGIRVSSDGSIWICVYRKLFRLSPDGKLLKSYPLQCQVGPGKEYCLYEDRAHRLLLSVSRKGLHLWNKEKDRFELVYPYEDIVNAIIQDNKSDSYWLATWRSCIVRLDLFGSGKRQRVPQQLPVNSIGESASTAMKIVQDDVFNYIWVVSWSDLFVYRVKDDRTLEQVNISSFYPKYTKILNHIMKDRNGNLWITASDNHNSLISFDKESLHTYQMEPLEVQLKATPYFERLCRDEDGVFWVFQRRTGICVYDPRLNKIESFKQQTTGDKNQLLVLTSLLKSKTKGLVWVVVEGQNEVLGLTRDGMKIEIKNRISLSRVTKQYFGVRCIFEDSRGNLYISAGDALYLYNPGRDDLRLVSDGVGKIKAMTQTANGMLWAILQDGKLVEIGADGKGKVWPQDFPLSCLAANGDDLWLGTDRGEVLCFHPSNGHTENFTEPCGMNGDRIGQIVVDHLKHVWVVTERSVTEFNPSNEANRSFYAASEELRMNRFLPDAVFAGQDGKLYFAGLPGILSVNPATHLSSKPHDRCLRVTDVKVMGGSILLDENRMDERRNSIAIRPDEQDIEIYFSSLDYLHSQKVRYAYFLEGVDKNWTYLPVGENMAFYNKLSKGNYRLKVKATDENGLWSERTLEFTLHRLPSWYETWYAYTLYILVVLAILWYVYQMMRNRIRMKQDVEMANLMVQKKEEVNHAKLQFFTNITHELLTPLSIISASVDEMKMEPDSDKQACTVIENNTQRLIRLIQQILEFRKVENGKQKLRVSPGNITAFLANSVSSFMPLIKKKKQTIVFERDNDYSGYFDVDKLDKIVYNLLSNAAKYTPQGGCITVRQTYDEAKGMFTVSVNNPGEPISDEKKAHLFERFYEGEYRKFHTIGTGIGLSLTKDLVTLHHGTIHVETSPETGNTFVVKIPILRSEYSEVEIDDTVDMNFAGSNNLPDEEVETVNAGSDSEEDGNGQTAILLVEDNEELRTSMVHLLQKRFHVLEAGNGVEALNLLKTNEVSLIVSDVMMPEMDGMELCRRVKETFDTSHIPVILLTAKITDEDQVEGYESGADGYICKPLRLSVLVAKIENLLKRNKRQSVDFRKQLVFEAKEVQYTPLDQAFLQKAMDCVNAHIEDPSFDTNEFLNLMGLARTTLTKKLKTLTGLTPSGFVNNARLQAAARILEENKDVRISDLAYNMGYTDPKYFTQLFKQKYGMSPKDYMLKFGSKSIPE